MVATKPDLLDAPIHRVREALAENAKGHENDWLREVGHTLEELISALRHHVSAAEAPNGALATLASPGQDQVATLNRQVRQLRDEHVELLGAVGKLLLHIEGIRTRCIVDEMSCVEDEEIPVIHDRVDDILVRLQAHIECEENLFMTVVTRDEPGAGD